MKKKGSEKKVARECLQSDSRVTYQVILQQDPPSSNSSNNNNNNNDNDNDNSNDSSNTNSRNNNNNNDNNNNNSSRRRAEGRAVPQAAGLPVDELRPAADGLLPGNVLPAESLFVLLSLLLSLSLSLSL